jgi:hypothetical protein
MAIREATAGLPRPGKAIIVSMASARTRRVLDPGFVEGLEGLPIEELRRRRDEALAEREFQSYLRRVIQVRHDLLSAERSRRAAGEEAPSAVDRVTEVLSGGPQGRGRGEAVRVALPEDDIELAERVADAAVGGELSVDAADDLSDQQLAEALERLGERERTVSADRAAILRIHDRFQEELKRRYREDPTLALR